MRYLSLIFIFGFTSHLLAQNTPKFTQNIDSLIYRYISENDIPSVSVGVVFRDTVLYGERIINDSSKVESIKSGDKSIYNIASVAKPFVATAIMILVQEGKISLERPIVDYLPDFEIDSKYKDRITIAQLLTHTSGLPSVSAPDDYEYKTTDISDQALENRMKALSSIKLLYKPGKKYSYSNVGFEVLGAIIANVSGMSFEQYMSQHIFGPLQMENTSYILTDLDAPEIAQPHVDHPYRRTERFPYNRRFSPSGNLFTSITDMNNWAIFNVNKGNFKGFKPLSDENYEMLINPKINTDEEEFIGLGWYIKSINGGRIIFHDGLDLGYSALMLLYEKPQIAIIVLANHQNVDCNELLNKIARSIDY